MSLEFLGTDQVKINLRTLEVGVIDPPFKDGNTHIVETTSSPTKRFQQQLQVKELKGLLGSMLPKGFQLSIYLPEARTRGLDHVTFENLLSGSSITISVSYYYQNWEQRKNLIHFANDLISKIETTIDKCQEASVYRVDVGVYISCSFSLEETDDVYEIYKEIDREFSDIYKNLLRDEDYQ